MQYYYAAKLKKIELMNKNIMMYILLTLLEGGILLIIKMNLKIGIISIGLMSIMAFIVYNVILYLLKDKNAVGIIDKVKSYIIKGEKK